jgi:CheY-like chemotaxis protein
MAIDMSRILIATDVASDAHVVQQLLQVEYANVAISTDPARFCADFEQHRPQVLILAFKTIEDAEAYYLAVCAHTTRHRTLLLCGKGELHRAYELCRSDCFDDYVLFWPLVHDAPRLPMAVHLALRALNHSSGEDLRPRAKRARPQLLVVDDDTFMRDLLARVLGAANYEVECVGDAAAALSFLRTRRPDLILMDVALPDIDGIALTRRLKASETQAPIPVIMLTGQSEKQVIVDSLGAGAADFIVKPFDRETLLKKVARYLET